MSAFCHHLKWVHLTCFWKYLPYIHYFMTSIHQYLVYLIAKCFVSRWFLFYGISTSFQLSRKQTVDPIWATCQWTALIGGCDRSANCTTQWLLFFPSLFFLNGPTTASFSFIFGLFKQTIQFLQQIYVNKCPSNIRYQESIPRPTERESLPITTRPGLPPLFHLY